MLLTHLPKFYYVGPSVSKVKLLGLGRTALNRTIVSSTASLYSQVRQILSLNQSLRHLGQGPSSRP